MNSMLTNELNFQVDVGTDKNYFVQSENGAFHVLLGNSPCSRCIVASPAGNAGCLITFDSKSPIVLSKPIEITGKEEVKISLKTDRLEIINLASMGSIRVLRSYTEGNGIEETFSHMKDILSKLDASTEEFANLENWLSPKWKFNNNSKAVQIKIKSLNGKDTYELNLECDEGKFQIIDKLSPSIGVNSRLQIPKGNISITYKSSFKPLTPFPVDELLNAKALKMLGSLPEKEKINAIQNLNALRFLAYKEKFLAGSWRFLTYFGRDTLLSLRMLAPIVTPEAIEAEFRGISEHLNDAGEIAHEEDLGDQAAIDQLNEWFKNNSVKSPQIEDKMISDFISVDTNYLALPLLLDYYYIGGKKLFSSNNSLYVSILKNINFVLSEASALKPVELRNGTDVGDWRDSQAGLAFGRYAFSVNGAMIPAALNSIDKLISLNAWEENSLKTTAKNYNLKNLKVILEKPEKLNDFKNHWFQMWKKFFVAESDILCKTTYDNGFIALSLDNDLKSIPIIHSDTLFMLLDLPIDTENNWLEPASAPFKKELPEGLMSDAGILVASPVCAPEKYKEMFDSNRYHGQVVWAWQNLMLKIALQKQLGTWAVPSPTNSVLSQKNKDELEKLLQRTNEAINNSKEWSTSELWSWKQGKNGKIIPVAYGQESGNETESNAVQLWSAAALGLQLWEQIKK